MKLLLLTDDQITILEAVMARDMTTLLNGDEGIKMLLAGPTFLPKIFAGLEGGNVTGATTNCVMAFAVGDHDIDDCDERGLVVLNAWQCDDDGRSGKACVSHLDVLVDPDVCDSLFQDARCDAPKSESITEMHPQ